MLEAFFRILALTRKELLADPQGPAQPLQLVGPADLAVPDLTATSRPTI